MKALKLCNRSFIPVVDRVFSAVASEAIGDLHFLGFRRVAVLESSTVLHIYSKGCAIHRKHW